MPFFAHNDHLTVVSVYELLDDGQSNPAASGISDARPPPKSVEDVVQIRLRNAPPRIFHGELSQVITRRDDYLDRSFSRSELEGICQEIRDDLVQPVLVASHNRGLKVAGQRKSGGLQLRPQRFDSLVCDARQDLQS